MQTVSWETVKEGSCRDRCQERISGPEKGVIWKGVFLPEKSLAILKTLESPENGRISFVFHMLGGAALLPFSAPAVYKNRVVFSRSPTSPNDFQH